PFLAKPCRAEEVEEVAREVVLAYTLNEKTLEVTSATVTSPPPSPALMSQPTSSGSSVLAAELKAYVNDPWSPVELSSIMFISCIRVLSRSIVSRQARSTPKLEVWSFIVVCVHCDADVPTMAEDPHGCGSPSSVA
ncbi:Phosphatidylglycerophosphatase and protein-tyrosine phosphatase 1, partial [Perkinsus olseni]